MSRPTIPGGAFLPGGVPGGNPLEDYLEDIIADFGADIFAAKGATETALSGKAAKTELPFVTPQMYGAKADLVTDDSAAILAAHASGKPVRLSGTYLVKQQLVFNGQTVLLGDGRDKAKIIWPADATSFGIKVIPSSWTDYVRIQDIGIWTRGTTGTAIDISWLHLGTTNLLHFDPRCYIERNDIRGDNVTTQYFPTGIRLDFVFGARIRDNFLQGVRLSGNRLPEQFPAIYGIIIPDQTTRTLANLHITGNLVFGYRDSVTVYNMEGLWYRDNDHQQTYNALTVINTIMKVNQYRVSGNHFGPYGTAARFVHCRQVLFSDNEVSYGNGRTDGGTETLIIFDRVYSGHISGNSIRGNVSNTTDVVVNGIELKNTSGDAADPTRKVTIDNNQFQNLATGVTIRSTTLRNILGPGNTFDNMMVARLTNEGTSNPIDTASMGPGPHDAPSGQTPALLLSGKSNAPLAVVRDTTGGVVLFYNTASTLVGSISIAASATTYGTTSDYRLKTDIADIAGSGEFIDALRPRTFTMGGAATAGFIAHEFAEVSPQSVIGEKDETDADGNPVYQSMQASTPEVMAHVIAELQALRQRMADVEGRFP